MTHTIDLDTHLHVGHVLEPSIGKDLCNLDARGEIHQLKRKEASRVLVPAEPQENYTTSFLAEYLAPENARTCVLV